ncbi:uncharacterized protein M6B38_275955 [Iris pallida]|uniref:Uncharacterized protein n=1 Tax=Iris pallida TaxID=29817 RepID=A0AAX6FVZ2_IRIPA|nr:uncharacterized protein M6B38_398090 [Iris pallida]KAJ6847774.1 uncharacterized protein M6B38_275955 [Iris pallida]
MVASADLGSGSPGGRFFTLSGRSSALGSGSAGFRAHDGPSGGWHRHGDRRLRSGRQHGSRCGGGSGQAGMAVRNGTAEALAPEVVQASVDTALGEAAESTVTRRRWGFSTVVRSGTLQVTGSELVRRTGVGGDATVVRR